MTIIKVIDNKSFEYNGIVYPTDVYMARRSQDKVSIVHKYKAGFDIVYELAHTEIQTQDLKGNVLKDGSAGDTLNEILASINSIVNFEKGRLAIEADRYSTYADLPTTDNTDNEIVIVENTTGVRFVNRKRSGFYIWKDEAWEYLSGLPEQIASRRELGITPHDPSIGYFKGNLVEYNDINYKCKAHISAKAFDAGDWEEFKTGSEPLVLEHTDDVKDASGLITSIYNAYSQGTHWVVDLYTASTDTRTTATPTNNPSYATLADAWADRTTLTYG